MEGEGRLLRISLEEEESYGPLKSTPHPPPFSLLSFAKSIQQHWHSLKKKKRGNTDIDLVP